MAAYWTVQTLAPDTVMTASNPELIRGSSCTLTFVRGHAVSVNEDKAAVTLHLTMRPGVAGVGAELNAADAQNVENDIGFTLWPAISPLISNQWTLDQIVWRHFGANNPLDENGVSKPGAIWRVATPALAGTASVSRVADQDCATTTYRTAGRKHWGRNYWGGLTINAFANYYGHLTPAYCDTLATGLHSTFNAFYAHARVIEPVVWSARYRGMLSIDDLVVDDVVDIQRSRRAKFATYRKIFQS